MATDLEVGQPQRATERDPPARNNIARKLIAMSSKELKEYLSRRVPAGGKQGTREKGSEKGSEKRLMKKKFGLLGKG